MFSIEYDVCLWKSLSAVLDDHHSYFDHVGPQIAISILPLLTLREVVARQQAASRIPGDEEETPLYTSEFGYPLNFHTFRPSTLKIEDVTDKDEADYFPPEIKTGGVGCGNQEDCLTDRHSVITAETSRQMSTGSGGSDELLSGIIREQSDNKQLKPQKEKEFGKTDPHQVSVSLVGTEKQSSLNSKELLKSNTADNVMLSFASTKPADSRSTCDSPQLLPESSTTNMTSASTASPIAESIDITELAETDIATVSETELAGVHKPTHGLRGEQQNQLQKREQSKKKKKSIRSLAQNIFKNFRKAKDSTSRKDGKRILQLMGFIIRLVVIWVNKLSFFYLFSITFYCMFAHHFQRIVLVLKGTDCDF